MNLFILQIFLFLLKKNLIKFKFETYSNLFILILVNIM